MSAPTPLQERLGNALYRLTAIERRAAAGPGTERTTARIAEDARKVIAELERCYEDVRELLVECGRHAESARAEASRAQRMFELCPAPALLLARTGEIADANAAAIQILNVTRRHLIGRPFQLYLGGGRDAFIDRMAALRDAGHVEGWEGTLRPRERSPLSAHLTMALDGDGSVLIVVQADRIARPEQPAEAPAASVRLQA
jgi:PAS domain-containing protein